MTEVSATVVVEAVVEAGGVVTRYRRAGRGRPVVLLAEEAPGHPAAGVLFRRLAEGFRVVAPEWVGAVWGPEGPDGDRLAGWLRGLVDGLGLDRPALVLDDGLARALGPFLEREADRIGRAVVLRRRGGWPGHPPGGAGGEVAEGGPSRALRPSILALDWPRSGLPEEAVTARLEAFLADGG